MRALANKPRQSRSRIRKSRLGWVREPLLYSNAGIWCPAWDRKRCRGGSLGHPVVREARRGPRASRGAGLFLGVRETSEPLAEEWVGHVRQRAGQEVSPNGPRSLARRADSGLMPFPHWRPPHGPWRGLRSHESPACRRARGRRAGTKCKCGRIPSSSSHESRR